MHTADSLALIGKGDSAIQIARRLKSKMGKDDPLITSYYIMLLDRSRDKPERMAIYADSALSFFSTQKRIKAYPDEYLKVLLAKGDASMKNKQFNIALDYLYKAKKLLAEGRCDDGQLAASIASIYYNQKNFRLAAQYWAENFRRIGACDPALTPQKRFYMQQGTLNNSALAYQRAGMEDSAMVYYNMDLEVLNKADSAGVVEKVFVLGARTVLYDNLGGLNLKNGKYAEAEKYLLACVNMNIPLVDGIKTPPYIKLAELYLITKQYDKAAEAFKQSKFLIKKFHKENSDSDIRWSKLYAQYLLELKQPDKAFQYLKTYIRLNDSVEKASANLYRVNVDRELSTFHQQQILTELRHHDKLNQIYLLCITIAVVLSVIIIVLINRNLNTSKKNHRSTEDHNRRLQQTLVELEAANKNYIRIMRVMAHDLRNPLAGITGLTALLLEEEEGFNEENMHILGLIQSTGINSIEMINELLKSGLADENEAVIMQPVDVKALLHDSVKLLQFKANEKNQQIIFENDERHIIANVSQEKIWRVFNNLIVNAIKFSYNGGQIGVDIGLTPDKKKIKIAITDHGVGIPDKDKGHIFDMFTTAKKPGTNGEEPFGLGLSITQKIVDQHHGKIWFTSQPGDTTFYVTLPNYEA
ncbi:MAG: tetratricopeptide repeat-containing sensor histidine kinase [Bacteroidota bacterium]